MEVIKMNKLKLGVLLVVCLLALSTAAAVTMAEEKKLNILDTIRGSNSNDNQYIPNEIIVKFKPGVKGSEIANINSKHKAEVLSTSQHGEFKLLKIAKGKSVPEMVEIYNRNPNVEHAEPNYLRHIFVNDPYFIYQWHMTKINVEPAWGISTGNNVVVAVLDTGVAYENYGRYALAPDLAGTNFVQGYDYINYDSHPNDDEGHGTHVTGTIAQTTNNGVGVVGIAYDASIMPVKVLNAAGSGTDFSVAQGIYYAIDNGADIISMSLGGEDSSQILSDAVSHADNNGVVVIAAAGNSETDVPHYPAAYDTVIAIGATRYDNTLAYYSNYGSHIDLVAPGGDINVDQNGDGYGDGVLQQTFSGNPRNFGYWFYQGTSMAAPHVTGVAAMLIANGVTGPNAVKEALENSAIDLGSSGWDDHYGHGIVDAYAALNYNPIPVDNDNDRYTSDVDCDDNNASIYPSAIEICNGVDDNCNELIDEGFDSDNDGYTTCGGDCNDNDPTIYPEAPETSCDGIDNDCDALTDEDYISHSCGKGACEVSSVCISGVESCTEGLPTDEVCGDNIDNDCDGETDEGCEPTVVCGDKTCAGISFGEDCRTCPEDCGVPLPRGVCCGDGKCDTRKGETVDDCPVDCQ